MVGLEFPKDRTQIQLDIVGLLAVVGMCESAMVDHVQPATNSFCSLLPRLVPAPQSFLRTNRPTRLPPNTAARVAAIRSGNYSQDLNYFPNILHGIDELPRFTVRTISIKQAGNGGEAGNPLPKEITVRRFGPMNILAIVGMLFFVGLLAAAIVLRDGMAVIAVVLLSVTSSLVSLASLWKVDLQRRQKSRQVPGGDVVVLGRQGSFVVVRCNEAIARELYFGQELCNYVIGDRLFQVIAALGTFMFMASVVFLANGTWNLQASIGLSYIILNGLYWVAGLLPPRYQWDLSGYDVKLENEAVQDSYTKTLVTVIRTTREIKWLKRARAVPRTEAWDSWLEEAYNNISNPHWDSQKTLTGFLSDYAAAMNVESETKPGNAQFSTGFEAKDGIMVISGDIV